MNDSELTSYHAGTEHIGSGLAAQTMWALSSKIITALLNAATMFLIVRLLLPDEYGKFSLVISIATLWFVVAEFGVGISVSKHVAQYRGTNRALASGFMVYGFLVQVAFAGAGAAACFLSAGYVARLLRVPELQGLLWLGSLLVILRPLQSYCLMGFLGFQKLNYYATVEVVREGARLAGSALLLSVGLGAAGAVGAKAASFALSAVLGLIIVWHAFVRGTPWRVRDSRAIVSQVMRLSPAILVISASDLLYTELTVPILGFFLNVEQVGYYSLPMRITVMLQMPAHALALAVAPRFAASDGQSKAAVRALFAGTVKTLLIFYVPVMFGLIALAPELITLAFGAQYLPSADIMRLYAIYLLAVSIGILLALALIYLGRARARAVVMVCIGLTNVGLNLIMIPRLGIRGAATAMLITYIPTVLVWLVIACRTIGLSMRRLASTALKIGCCGLVMGVTVYLIGHNAGVARLLIAVIAGIGVYGAALLVARVVTAEELRKIMLQRARAKETPAKANPWN